MPLMTNMGGISNAPETFPISRVCIRRALEVRDIVEEIGAHAIGLVFAVALIAPPKATAQVHVGVQFGAPSYGYVVQQRPYYAYDDSYVVYAPNRAYGYRDGTTTVTIADMMIGDTGDTRVGNIMTIGTMTVDTGTGTIMIAGHATGDTMTMANDNGN